MANAAHHTIHTLLEVSIMNLEETITQGRVSYIESIEHDPVERRLVIRFVNDPEEQVVDRILTFSEVSDFSNELNWDDDDEEDCLDSLLGVREYPKPEGIRYQVNTEQREMLFLTSIAPRIETPQVGAD
jgi:hypothetical protein